MRVLSPLLAILLLSSWSCGGSQQRGKLRSARAHEDFNVPTFLIRYAEGTTQLFADLSGDVDTLKKSLRKLSKKERRAAYRRLAALYLARAEEREERKDAKRDWRNAKRAANKSLKGARDSQSRSEAIFVHMWCAWRLGAPDAKRRAETFTEAHRESGDLHNMAWIIRGEIDLRGKRFEAARKNYRFMFGQLDHPLYALALLRTADAHEAQENIEEADAALEEVLMLACDASAKPESLEISRVAAGQLEIKLREDAQGVLRPTTCKEIKRQGNPDKPWLN